MADKINVQGDPYWAKATSNIAEMFNPKAAAQGSNLLAQTRLNNAKAAGAEDQNDALTEAALAKAGYSPMEIAAMRAARDNSVASIFRGINLNRGREALGRGDLVASSVLTGQASALPEIQKAITIKDYVTGADGKTDKGLAGAFLADGGKNIDGNLLTFGSDGMPKLGALTDVGKSIVDLNRQKAATVLQTGNVNEEYKGVQGDMLKDKTAAQIEALVSLTDAKIAEMVANGADGRWLNEARRQAIATKAAATKPVDVVKGANNEAVLIAKLDELYTNDFAQLGDKKTWALLDNDQKVRLRNRAIYYIKNEGLGVTEAMAKSNAYHGITGSPSDTTQGKKGIIFKDPDGKLKINGFKIPDESTADVVAAGSAGAAPVPVPAIKVPDKKKAAPAAPAATKAAAPAATKAAVAPAKKTESVPAGAIDLSTKTYAQSLGIKPEDLLKYSKAAGITVKEYHDKIKANPAALEALKKATQPAASPAAPAAKKAPAAKPAPAKEVKPEPGVIVAKTQADIDNAPPGAIIEVNGQRFKKPFPKTK